MFNYPSDQLLYWQHICNLPLKAAVIKYFSNEPLLEIELSPIKDYVKHWIELGFFEDETDSEFLLRELENCKNVGSLNLVIHRLLDFGIDPF
jgi:hypothetical protein